MSQPVPADDALIPAAQYLRMSTELQDLSIEVQAQINAQFASQRGFDIVRTYEDAGRSGLTISTRPGLKQLVADVVGGTADYRAVLVYDVSRWGRFQDIDESAHYEFLCRQMGINIHYCAELFDNNTSSLSSLMKSMKRVMAAEYSRDLSTKVRLSQERLAARGFWVNGTVPYGFARLIVNRNGNTRGVVLEDGERKNVKNDRIILIPGPPDQVANVRRIFDLYVLEGHGRREIVKRLNVSGQRTRSGRPWREASVTHILRNEAYIGTLVWGREHNWLGQRKKDTPPETWLRVPNAFEALVDPSLFRMAQELFTHRNLPRDTPRDELLARLRALMDRNGELARSLLYTEPDILHSPVYRAQFGSMRRAFKELGYADLPRRLRRAPKSVKNLRWRLIDRLMVGLRARGYKVERDAHCRHIVIEGELKLAVVLMRVGLESMIRDAWQPSRYDSEAALIVRAWQWRDDPVDYYLVADTAPRDEDLPPHNVDPLPKLAHLRLRDLEAFYGWIAGLGLEPAPPPEWTTVSLLAAGLAALQEG